MCLVHVLFIILFLKKLSFFSYCSSYSSYLLHPPYSFCSPISLFYLVPFLHIPLFRLIHFRPFHFILFHFILLHFILFHFILFHFILFCYSGSAPGAALFFSTYEMSKQILHSHNKNNQNKDGSSSGYQIPQPAIHMIAASVGETVRDQIVFFSILPLLSFFLITTCYTLDSLCSCCKDDADLLLIPLNFFFFSLTLFPSLSFFSSHSTLSPLFPPPTYIQVHIITRICSAVFGVAIIGCGVPIFCVIIKTSLYSNRTCNGKWSFFGEKNNFL